MPLGVCLYFRAGSFPGAAHRAAAGAQRRGSTRTEAQLAAQQEQLRNLTKTIQQQQQAIEKLTVPSETKQAENDTALPPGNQVASTTPMVPPDPADSDSQKPVPAAPAAQSTTPVSPLQLKIGNATLTPVGFMDMTAVFRSTNVGSGIGTNFGSIPLSNTTQGKLTETRFSAQNSRVGFRFDSDTHGAKVLGYLEADFLGNAPSNLVVGSNSDTLRMRLYYLDVQKNGWEFLGGQSWSMLTPGRKGISPLPGNIFYSQNMDTNYQVGLVWSRDPQFRVVYHPSDTVAMGLSLENPEQYIGGSSGAGATTLPSGLASAYGSQLDSGSSSSTPNMSPNVIGKIALDPQFGKGNLHFEAAGLLNTFRLYNPATLQHFSAAGGGGSVNVIYSPVKNFRLLSLNYWSDGGGRYLFGLAPDLVVRADGSPSLVHAGSTIDGFEYQKGNSAIAAYYGGLYIGRNVVIDPATGKLVGYGFSGSGTNNNRTIQEATIDYTRTLWKDAKWGSISMIMQYSYLTRDPWYVAAGIPSNASTNMAFFDLRYTLPGSAPAGAIQ